MTGGMTHHHGGAGAASGWYPTSADGNDWLNAAAGPSQQLFHNTFQTRSNWPPPPPPPPPYM